MAGVQIDLKRTGFPVKVGDMELWFSTSLENLKTFFSIDEKVEEKMKIVQEKASHLHFPEDLDKEPSAEKVKEVEGEVSKTIDLNKEYVALHYDLVFGDGTFKKLYKKYPDIQALELAMEPLFLAMAEKLAELEKEHRTGFEAIKKEMMKQKHQKKKK
ncbi:hypothetical protein [Oceanobacillus sojae]|uniref:hypothetical protein n=1 Tax=Oceanobacillus sojae TaxID=582851 RepID=UPI0021A73102|nr:hypothetical protein [Oceanobacillus sojae]MCT1904119.1 hypothetical protein [Oceanobacillus sojae]